MTFVRQHRDFGNMGIEVWDHSRFGVVRASQRGRKEKPDFQIACSDWQKLIVSNCVEGSPNDPSVLCMPGHRRGLAKKHGQAAN